MHEGQLLPFLYVSCCLIKAVLLTAALCTTLLNSVEQHIPFRRVCFASRVECRWSFSELSSRTHATKRSSRHWVLNYKSLFSWLHLPVPGLLSDFRLCLWASEFACVYLVMCVCVCIWVYAWLCSRVHRHLCLGDRKWWKSKRGDVVWRDGRLETDSVFPSVSPLNLNLPAPHGRSQPSMGLCFASKSRCRVPSERALLRRSLMCLFPTSNTSGCTGWSSSCCCLLNRLAS